MHLRSLCSSASLLLVVISAQAAAQQRSAQDSLATVRVRVAHDDAPIAGAIVRSGAAGGR